MSVLVADPAAVVPKKSWAKFLLSAAQDPRDILFVSSGVKVLFHRVDSAQQRTGSGFLCVAELLGTTHRWNSLQQGLRFDTLEQALEVYTKLIYR